MRAFVHFFVVVVKGRQFLTKFKDSFKEEEKKKIGAKYSATMVNIHIFPTCAPFQLNYTSNNRHFFVTHHSHPKISEKL